MKSAKLLGDAAYFFCEAQAWYQYYRRKGSHLWANTSIWKREDTLLI